MRKLCIGIPYKNTGVPAGWKLFKAKIASLPKDRFDRQRLRNFLTEFRTHQKRIKALKILVRPYFRSNPIVLQFGDDVLKPRRMGIDRPLEIPVGKNQFHGESADCRGGHYLFQCGRKSRRLSLTYRVECRRINLL